MNQLNQVHARAPYDPAHFLPLFANEEHHFWFRSRNRCITAATRLIPNVHLVKNIVEHGCGTGFVLAKLQRTFPNARIMGTDLFAEGLAFARRRFSGPLVQADFTQYDARQAFDLVGLFDVLEHLDDDLQALRAIREQLRPGGCLLLTVPAHMTLWSDYDKECGHRRRYTRTQLMGRLAEAGLQTEFCTEFMLALFPVMWVRRRVVWGQTKGAGQSHVPSVQLTSELKINPAFNFFLDKLLRPEAWWIRRGRRLPRGTSLLAIATRNES